MLDKTCLHGNKWDECCFGCKLWQYTRAWRRHWVDDGEFYKGGHGIYCDLWTIASSAPYGRCQNKHGYDLYHKGSFVLHGGTVGQLKKVVADAMAEQWGQVRSEAVT